MAPMRSGAIAGIGRPEDRRGSEPVPGYRLLHRVGSGGSGEVWCAEAPGGLRVALKIVRLAGGLGRRELENLHILRAIRHPNLLAYFGAWTVRGRLIIGMELADRSLWDRFAEARGRGLAGIPLVELLEIMQEVARVVDFLNEPSHEVEGRAGVAIHHRDIKPQNIMLIGRGVKVADLGLSCPDDRGGTSGSQCGLTVAYAAPETFRRRVSASTDQYSLAVTYCQMRGGRLPFAGPPAAVMMGHLLGEPDLSMLPEPERPIVGRALAKDPESRWPDCRSFVEGLARGAGEGWPETLAAGPGVPDDPGSVEVPALSEPWEGSVSASSIALAGIDPEDAASAYCLDLPVAREAILGDDPAETGMATVVAAGADGRVRRARPTSRLAVAAASLLLAGVVAWSWSARRPSRAAAPDPSSSGSIPAMATRPSPGPPRLAEVVTGVTTGPRPAAPAPPPPPIPARSRRVERTSAARLPELKPFPAGQAPRPDSGAFRQAGATDLRGVPTRVAAYRDRLFSTWEPRIRKATALARTWLADARAAPSKGPAPRPADPPAPDAPPPPSELHVGMPELLVIEAGRSLPIPIQVNRAGRDEPLAVHFEGLPAGVEIPDVTIPPGRDRAEVLARARLDAPAATAPVALAFRAGTAHAVARLRMQVRANPAMLQRTRGLTLLACGRPAEAVAALTEAMRAGVADASIYHHRGLAYASLDRVDLAIRDFTEALRLRPADPLMHYSRGVAYARRRDDFRALLDLDAAIRLRPDLARAYEARAQVYRRQGDLARACADLTRADDLARAARPEGRPPAPRPPDSLAPGVRTPVSPGSDRAPIR